MHCVDGIALCVCESGWILLWLWKCVRERILWMDIKLVIERKWLQVQT